MPQNPFNSHPKSTGWNQLIWQKCQTGGTSVSEVSGSDTIQRRRVAVVSQGRFESDGTGNLSLSPSTSEHTPRRCETKPPPCTLMPDSQFDWNTYTWTFYIALTWRDMTFYQLSWNTAEKEITKQTCAVNSRHYSNDTAPCSHS